MIPASTYRLQFHRGFTFDQAAALAPYFARLGISHVYASPILTARAGSPHGYDIVDHSRINAEIGGSDGFHRLAAALAAQSIGIIVDIVPNHMAVGGADNAWWLDLLQKGTESRYAHYFDVDFDSSNPRLRGKVLAPFLGAPYSDILASSELKLVHDDTIDGIAIAYHHHHFPIRVEDQQAVAADPRRFATPDALDALLERQHFRLAWWRDAAENINWRRFFDVNELAGLRVEDAGVFEAIHAVTFDLYAKGLIDGVRVDHVDGLADPAGYCATLRDRLAALATQRPSHASSGPAYIVVEKILGRDEALADDWRVDGTSGYDFMNRLSAVQHAEAGAPSLTATWVATSGRSGDFEEEELAAREEVLLASFGGQLDAMSEEFHRLAVSDSATRGLDQAALRSALVLIIKRLRVYRTYATGRPGSPPPGAAFDRAVDAAKADAPKEVAALTFIAECLSRPDAGDAVRRFNQLTAPVAAKAVEDTAFYRYGRLISRNDVGFDPRRLGLSIDIFHRDIATRAKSFPNAMSTTATHDHKRGEDMRARLAVLSTIADTWRETTDLWHASNEALRPSDIARDDEYQLYQTLVGAWPLTLSPTDHDGLRGFAKRLAGWQQKALREAKLRSSWVEPNDDYETKSRKFLEALLDPKRSAPFIVSIAQFVYKIAPAGAVNGLVQAVLRNTLPGVPDLYQGTEFWDFTLVDPDNRRPVDYAARVQAIEHTENFDRLLETWRDGRIKQFIIAKLLRLRAAKAEFFHMADYTPLTPADLGDRDVIGFRRRCGKESLLVLAPLRVNAAAAPQVPVSRDPDWANALAAYGQRDELRGYRDIFLAKSVDELERRNETAPYGGLPALVLFRSS